ncbi:MAG: hypothetical protein WCT05_14240 [Lentisphaeria bacterium]
MKDFDKDADGTGDLQQIADIFCRGSRDIRRRNIIFHTGRNNMPLFYCCCADERHVPDNAQCHVPSMSGLGMSDAWYVNGFVNVSVDGVAIASSLPMIDSEELDGEGRARYTWNVPAGPVTIEVSAAVGDPFLTMIVTLPEPQTSAGAVMTFLCYPSRLVAEVHDRFCVTASARLTHWKSKEWKKLALDDFWILYGDRHWDKGRPEVQNACSGPCALAFLPAECPSAELQIHNYEIFTRFVSRAGGKRHFLIWPSFGLPNDHVIRQMQKLTLKKIQ